MPTSRNAARTQPTHSLPCRQPRLACRPSNESRGSEPSRKRQLQHLISCTSYTLTLHHTCYCYTLHVGIINKQKYWLKDATHEQFDSGRILQQCVPRTLFYLFTRNIAISSRTISVCLVIQTDYEDLFSTAISFVACRQPELMNNLAADINFLGRTFMLKY